MSEEITEENSDDDNSFMMPVYVIGSVASIVTSILNAAAGNKTIAILSGLSGIGMGLGAAFGGSSSPNSDDALKAGPEYPATRKSNYAAYLPKNDI